MADLRKTQMLIDRAAASEKVHESIHRTADYGRVLQWKKTRYAATDSADGTYRVNCRHVTYPGGKTRATFSIGFRQVSRAIAEAAL